VSIGGMKMSIYYVYKNDWCHYTEQRGCIVFSSSWQRAKGIAMARMHWCWEGTAKADILVEEIDLVEEGVLCTTDRIDNSKEHN
jgi:hypothetical protein